MENLKQLNAERLSEIIKGFQGKIFQGEAQFQFDLAWRFQEIYGPETKVNLEDMRMVKKNNEGKITQKSYTDIVVEQGVYSVAIELKYKTAKYNNKAEFIQLLNHGAVDLSRYDYLWDVHRIEQLTGQSAQDNKEKDGRVEVLKKCNKGLAVLLTNEEKYWKETGVKKEVIDRQFHFSEEAKKLVNKKMSWEKDGDTKELPKTVLTGSGKPSFRAQPIALKKAYGYQWFDYRKALPGEPKQGTFRFVIIEVN